MSHVSVIVPTYNKAEYLELTLIGYTLQTYTDFEIVLVDDGSTDGTRQVADSFSDAINLRYFYQPNAGRSKARNRALEEANGEILVFNDDDRIPAPGFLAAHVSRLDSKQDLISVGQKVEVISFVSKALNLAWDERLRDFVRRNPDFNTKELEDKPARLMKVDDLSTDFWSTIEKYVFRTGRDNFSDVIEKYGPNLDDFIFGWAICTTGNLALRRPRGESGLRFDEAYTGWGMEDTDYAFQLCRNGYRVVHCTDAENFHQVHPRPTLEVANMTLNLKRFCTKYLPLEDSRFYKRFTLESNRDTVAPGSNLMALYVRFLIGDYTLQALNELVLQLRDAEPSLFVQDYLWLARTRTKAFLPE